jgi:hypothetical protein
MTDKEYCDLFDSLTKVSFITNATSQSEITEESVRNLLDIELDQSYLDLLVVDLKNCVQSRLIVENADPSLEQEFVAEPVVQPD